MIKQESVLTVLMYLFKYHIEQDCHVTQPMDHVIDELEQVGFERNLIDKALSWLSDLEVVDEPDFVEPSSQSLRILNPAEQEAIDIESQSLLLTLEQLGILNPVAREKVIHQLLALIEEDIEINLVKWVTLIVLFSQPEESKALQAMEFLVLDGTAGGIH